MNNPFRYDPHPLCQMAVKEVCRMIEGGAQQDWTAFREEIAQGKMFGVLVVEGPHATLHYLVAYSGQVCGRSDWEGFVPAVFDYLQEDGYFKMHEAEITRLNQQVKVLSESAERKELLAQTALLRDEAQQMIESLQEERRKRRSERTELEETDIRESQFLNAELRRVKKQYAERIEQVDGQRRLMDDEILRLKQERRSQSDALQRWLFSHFEMLNARGEKKNLLDIFADTVFKLPPAGAGECCEPKLLQYAYAHGLRPLCMAMFWYGNSPKTEIRHHRHYYPACSGKCKPILTWMLGNSFLTAPWEDGEQGTGEVPILYEDEHLLVVDKPGGMLSVPGKTDERSVLDFARSHCPDATGPMMVHRLDQATSGLLVIAKTEEAYHNLQQQFLHHQVKKRYVALLTSPIKESEEGFTLSLPLRPDPLNRPYQVVDKVHGKPAVTFVEPLGGNRVALYPQTGRTHQLRVHCAHPDGLDNPILGDELYGQKGERLYLHAESLEFIHPQSHESMSFHAPADF